MIRQLITISAAAIVCWLGLLGTVFAQDAETDAAALAKKIQNPLAAMITLPLQANYNTGVGPWYGTHTKCQLEG